MANTVASATAIAHRVSLENLRLSPAKANLMPRENRANVGAVLHRAIAALGWSLKEAAAVLEMDPAQLSRWIAGAETVQMHRIWGTRLHGPFAIELAGKADGVVVETTVTIRRLA